jgi:protein-S-isoprenylcysteine O-methyltransferase Ste14
LPALVDSFARFVLEGLGTPAPLAPAKKLVVTGFYRFVRNPMYVSLLAIILGQALLFGEARLIVLAGLAWLASHIFVVKFEEPRLEREFGAQYAVYKNNVPRWIPRLTPWRQG